MSRPFVLGNTLDLDNAGTLGELVGILRNAASEFREGVFIQEAERQSWTLAARELEKAADQIATLA